MKKNNTIIKGKNISKTSLILARFYKKPVGYGAYTPWRVVSISKDCPRTLEGDVWIMARPEPYYSLIERLKQAWDVMTYKADALYWGETEKFTQGKGLKNDGKLAR